MFTRGGEQQTAELAPNMLTAVQLGGVKMLFEVWGSGGGGGGVGGGVGVCVGVSG